LSVIVIADFLVSPHSALLHHHHPDIQLGRNNGYDEALASKGPQ
jgi:hypothetical protein